MNQRGEKAETLAADFLCAKGLRIAEKNYRSRYGEIDLIAREGATVVFVEVRSRSSETYGGAAASITTAKREKLIKTARHYLAGISPLPPCRFDAVLISGEPPRIEWIRNAFEE